MYFLADSVAFNHDFFKKYNDPLVVQPGVDHQQAIGTEMRYFGVQHSLTETPEIFKDALKCDRCFKPLSLFYLLVRRTLICIYFLFFYTEK